MNTQSNPQGLIAVTDAPTTETGAMVFWRLDGDIEHEALAEAWKNAGLPESQRPLPGNAASALSRAVAHVSKKRQLVRPTEVRGVHAIVHETAKGRHVGHDMTGTVGLTGGETENPMPEFGEGDAGSAIPESLQAEIRAAYLHARRTYNADEISGMMSHWLRMAGAVPLRDKGGFYFVPRHGLEQWRTVTRVLGEVSTHTIYDIPAMDSAGAVKAILDALTGEATKVVEATEAELIDEDLTERKLRTRAAKVSATVDKVAKYEDLLGASLDALRERLDHLRGQLAAAILMAQSDDEAA